MILNYKAIGETIRLEREKREWTQEDLAEKVGVTEQYVSVIEKGKKKPSLNILVNIAEIYGVSLDYLTCMRSDKRTAESSRAERILLGTTPYEYEVLITFMEHGKKILKQYAPIFKEKDKEK